MPKLCALRCYRFILCAFIMLSLHGQVLSQTQLSTEKLGELSLEELLSVTITTASRYAQAMNDAPAAVSIVTSEDIRRFGWKNLAEIIKAQCGFDVFSDRIYNFVMPRGFYLSNDPNSRILLMLDGHSVVEFFGYYNGHLASMDVSHIDRIEIVRGPNSALYGTNAMFAVINVISRKAGDKQAFRTGYEAGSFAHNKLTASLHSDTLGLVNYSVQGSWMQSDKQILHFDEYDHAGCPSGGYTSGEANRERSENLAVRIGGGPLTLNAVHFKRRKHVPTGIYGGAFNSERTFFQDQNQFVTLQYDWKLSPHTSGYAKLYFDSYQFNGRFAYVPDSSGLTGPPYESEFSEVDNKDYGGQLHLVRHWGDRHITIAGAEYKSYASMKFRYISENDDAHTLDQHLSVDPGDHRLSLYCMHTTTPVDKIVLEAGLHYDDYATVGDHLSPRCSIGYRILDSGWLKLLYGEAFRAPNYWEVNDQEALFFVEGNNRLTPEVIRNFELLFDNQFSQHVHGRASLFYYALDDNIQQVSGRWENVEGITGWGVESELHLQFAGALGYINGYYADVRHRQNDARLLFAPAWTFKMGFSKIFDKGVGLAVENMLTGARRSASPDDMTLPAYILTNVTLSWLKLTNWLNISFRIQNLFNVVYQHPAFLPDLASQYQNVEHPVYDIPADGRTFLFKVEMGIR